MKVLNSKQKIILDYAGDMQVLNFNILLNGSVEVSMFEDIEPEIIPKECLVSLEEFKNALYFQALMDIGYDEETNNTVINLITEVYNEYKNIFGIITSKNSNADNYVNKTARKNHLDAMYSLIEFESKELLKERIRK